MHCVSIVPTRSFYVYALSRILIFPSNNIFNVFYHGGAVMKEGIFDICGDLVKPYSNVHEIFKGNVLLFMRFSVILFTMFTELIDFD